MSTCAAYFEPSALHFQFISATFVALSNTRGGSDDTILTSPTLPFSSIVTNTPTRPFLSPARIASGGKSGALLLGHERLCRIGRVTSEVTVAVGPAAVCALVSDE